MSDNNSVVEKRLRNMKDFYLKASDLIDNLPKEIPSNTKNKIKDTVLGDKELKQLMEGLDSHRPPRIFLIGRTGVGKSSLINALCGSYVARVSDTTSCTATTNIYKCMDGDRVLMEILDTRGIAESVAMDKEQSAEEALIEQINEFSPDVAIFMLNCTHRDDILEDVEFLKNLAASYAKINDLRLPIVVVVNKSDEMAPTRFKDPKNYPQRKKDKIQEQVQFYKSIIVKNGLKIDNILAVSSLIDWMTPDGMEVNAEDIDNLPQSDIDHLQMAFDGRYQIEELFDLLAEAIQDFEAQMGLRMAARLNDVVKRISKQLIIIFSTISGGVAATPIPIADIYILLLLQSVMVSLIASLSGRDISLESAKEFIFNIAGVVGAGFAFRFIAQQGTKLVNLIMPGVGSVVSSVVATSGTAAIGNAAVSYYIDGKDLAVAKAKFEEAKKERLRKKEDRQGISEE